MPTYEVTGSILTSLRTRFVITTESEDDIDDVLNDAIRNSVSMVEGSTLAFAVEKIEQIEVQ
jgi:hypothetical protein